MLISNNQLMVIILDFRIDCFSQPKNEHNSSFTVFLSAAGEPPLMMASSALFAIKHAIEAVRAEIQQDTFFPLSKFLCLFVIINLSLVMEQMYVKVYINSMHICIESSTFFILSIYTLIYISDFPYIGNYISNNK